jgi:hypothetical protein
MTSAVQRMEEIMNVQFWIEIAFLVLRVLAAGAAG